jgi:N6-adenosine-specific RNA methylase IME4
MTKYKTIYADPPWQIKAGRPIGSYHLEDGKQIWNCSEQKSREVSFDTMSVNQISAMPVKDIAADDAHLYMWATNSHLPFAFEIIKKWGFNYSTTLVWAKNPMGGGLGGSFRITTEFLVFARRGNLKAKATTVGTWFNVKRQYENGYPKHSLKPSFFHELIEKTSPGPYVELFARREREGWDVYGNEVSNSIELPSNAA